MILKGIDIADNYICNKHICREERQYALFLYIIFLRAKNSGWNSLDDKEKAIVKACLEHNTADYNITIKHVFYEATLMRDAFESNRTGKSKFNNKCFIPNNNQAFNELLLETLWNSKNVYEFAKKGNELNSNLSAQDAFKEIPRFYNLKNLTSFNNKDDNNYSVIMRGHPENLNKNNDELAYYVLLEAHNMMNAKPDIMVIYEINGKTLYKCLECKYTSNETKNENYEQTRTQRNILRFLFDKQDSNNQGVTIVRFLDTEEPVYNESEVDIPLSVLIKQYCKSQNKGEL